MASKNFDLLRYNLEHINHPSTSPSSRVCTTQLSQLLIQKIETEISAIKPATLTFIPAPASDCPVVQPKVADELANLEQARKFFRFRPPQNSVAVREAKFVPGLRRKTRLLFSRQAEKVPKESRNNPLRKSTPLLSSQVREEGVLRLTTRGAIKRSADCTPALVKAAPVIQRLQFCQRDPPKKVTVHRGKYVKPDKNSKHSIYSVSMKSLGRAEPREKLTRSSNQRKKVALDQQQQRGLAKGQELLTNLLQFHDQLYGIRVEVREGKVVHDSEYMRLKQKYGDSWGGVKGCLRQLEKASARLGFKLVRFWVEKLVGEELQLHSIRFDRIVECIDSKLAEKALAVISLKPAQKEAKEKIERLLGKLIRRRLVPKKVQVIKSFCIMLACRNSVRHKRQQLLSSCEQLQKQLRNSWDESERPLEVHVPSFSTGDWQRLTSQNIKVYEYELLRAFRQNVDVILVVPKLSSDLLALVQTLRGEMSFTGKAPLLIEVQPFPQYISLACQLYYSSKALRTIKEAVQGRVAYIVPGRTEKLADYTQLGCFLKLPLYCLSNKLSQLDSATRVKDFLHELQLPVLPYERVPASSTFQFLCKKLTILLLSARQILKWVLKLDREHMGRGIAIIDFSGTKELNYLLSKQSHSTEDLFSLFKIISSILSFKLKPCSQKLYTRQQFLVKLLQEGGLVEPFPPGHLNFYQLCYELTPTGTLHFLGCVELIQGRPCSIQAYLLSHLPWLKPDDLASPICEYLSDLNAFGFFSLTIIKGEGGFWCSNFSPQFTFSHGLTVIYSVLQRPRCRPNSLFAVPSLFNPNFSRLNYAAVQDSMLNQIGQDSQRRIYLNLFSEYESFPCFGFLALGCSAYEAEANALAKLLKLKDVCGEYRLEMKDDSYRCDIRPLALLISSLKSRLKMNSGI